MTLEQKLLIRIYAEQKMYNVRMVELLCALNEQIPLETPIINIMAPILIPRINEDINDLVQEIEATQPDNVKFSSIHGITNEELSQWLDGAVDRVKMGEGGIFKREGFDGD